MKKWFLLFILLFPLTVYAANEQGNFTCIKNTSACWIPVFVVDTTTNDAKTGVTPSTVYYDIDNGTSTSLGTITNNCSTGNRCEKDSTNQAGKYL